MFDVFGNTMVMTSGKLNGTFSKEDINVEFIIAIWLVAMVRYRIKISEVLMTSNIYLYGKASLWGSFEDVGYMGFYAVLIKK